MLVRPDEIIAEIRKHFPFAERIAEPRRATMPRVVSSNEYLYGVPIYVYGEGVKGQYLRHSFVDREGQRYWLIEYGWTTVYGETVDGVILPLVVLGMPTRFVFEYKPAEFRRFKLEEVPVGYLECLERQMLNLDRVMRGEDPILIIDRYDLLRDKRGPVPSEFIDRIIEQQKLIETLQKTLWEYEKTITDYRTNIEILRARLAKLQEVLTEYESKLVKLSTEVTGVQKQLVSLREELVVRGAETEALTEARKKLRDLIDHLTEIIGDVTSWIESLKQTVETGKKAVGGGKQ